jgi:hypothetical protein
MNWLPLEQLARALLYEGYILYPYRPSAVKNQQRFNFGVLTPPAYSAAQGGAESSVMQTECLVLGTARSTLDLSVRFLQLRERTEPDKPDWPVWQEAVEREIEALDWNLHDLLQQPRQIPFYFPAARETEFVRNADGKLLGEIVRRQAALSGKLEVRAIVCDAPETAQQLCRLTLRIVNETPFAHAAGLSRNQVLLQAMVSAHTLLHINGGAFVSLLEPPAELAAAAAACRNLGTWPVLAGVAGERSLLLSSPIILYDYPQIAQESTGDLFDGAEIDELLTLRILTLTDDEKQEMRGGDERARQLLERTETLPEAYLSRLHGVLREFNPAAK